MRLPHALALAGLALAMAPASAGAVTVTDPAGDATCAPGCPDLVSVEETQAGGFMRFTFRSATPWGTVTPELRIWTSSPDSAHYDIAVTRLGPDVTVERCGDWSDRYTCTGGDQYAVERPTPTTVAYEVPIGVAHRWRAQVGSDVAPGDLAPDGAPVPGVALADRDGDGFPDRFDACPEAPGDGDGCPPAPPEGDRPFFFVYHCPTGGTRTFVYAFRPDGGGAPTAPARAVHPFDAATDAFGGPSLGVATPDGAWRAWFAPRAFLTPKPSPRCDVAGPSPPPAKRPEHHRAATRKAITLRCRFQSKFGYLTVFGTTGASPSRVRRVVAHDFVIRHFIHRHRERTLLSATLTGTPKLVYDRSACTRDALR